MDELIERLEKQPRWMGMPPDWPTPQEAASALRAAAQREAELREVLENIAQGDVPRIVAVPWREKPSKHDKCPHSLMMYEDCGECIGDYARAILAKHSIPSRPSQREGTEA